MQIKVILIDDEPAAIDNLICLLTEFEQVKILRTFTIANTALDWLLDNQTDLIFLDIEMPGMTGLEFLNALEKYPEKPCIVFTTGHLNYAIDAIRNTAFDFLLKPIARADLEKVIKRHQLKRCNDQFRKNTWEMFRHIEPPQKIVFPHYRGFVGYHPNEILYIEADRNYSNLYLTNGKTQIVSSQLGQIEKAIPHSHFFRINRHTIINIRYFTHADQKLRKCFLEIEGQPHEFPILPKQLKELQKVLMGGK